MAALNKVMLIGNLGRDPELRHTPGGTSVASFSIATTERWKDKSGQQQEETEWHNIVAWKGLADIASKYLTKGSQVFIEGKLKTRKWNDRDGNPRQTTEVVASNMVLLGPKGSGQSQDTGRNDSSYDGDFGGITDNDIPF